MRLNAIQRKALEDLCAGAWELCNNRLRVMHRSADDGKPFSAVAEADIYRMNAADLAEREAVQQLLDADARASRDEAENRFKTIMATVAAFGLGFCAGLLSALHIWMH